MKRRALAVLLTASMAAMLAACGGNSGAASSKADTAATTAATEAKTDSAEASTDTAAAEPAKEYEPVTVRVAYMPPQLPYLSALIRAISKSMASL